MVGAVNTDSHFWLSQFEFSQGESTGDRVGLTWAGVQSKHSLLQKEPYMYIVLVHAAQVYLPIS